MRQTKNKLIPVLHHLTRDPRAFFTLQPDMDLRCWPSSVQTSHFLCPSLYAFLLIGCCVEILLLGLCQRMACQSIHWPLFLQLNRQREAFNGAQVAQVRIPASVRLEERTLGFLMGRFRVRFHRATQPHNNFICDRHRIPGRTVLITDQSGVVSLSRSSSSGSTKNLVFVLVDVEPLMRPSLATCLTGTRQSLSLRRFHHENIILFPRSKLSGGRMT